MSCDKQFPPSSQERAEAHDLRQRVAGWHFSQECLTKGECEILHVAEKLDRLLGAEIERADRAEHEQLEAEAALWHIVPGTEEHIGETYRQAFERAEQAAKEAYAKLEFALQFVHTMEGFTFPDGEHWEAGSNANAYCPNHAAKVRAEQERESLRSAWAEERLHANIHKPCQADLTAARERIAELQQEIEAERVAAQHDIAVAEAERDALRAELAQAKRGWEDMRAERDAARRLTMDTISEFEQLEAELAQAQERIATLVTNRRGQAESSTAQRDGYREGDDLARRAEHAPGLTEPSQAIDFLRADLAAAKLEGARLQQETLDRVIDVLTAFGIEPEVYDRLLRMKTEGVPGVAPSSLAADLGAMRELVRCAGLVRTVEAMDPDVGLYKALANVPAWLKGRGE